VDKLPKPRMFSGLEQTKILENIANYEYNNRWLTTENKLLKNQVAQLEEAFDLKERVHDKLNKDYVELRDENKRLQSIITNLVQINSEHHENIRKMDSVLRYYANIENYKHIPIFKPANVLLDNGEFARYVLDGESNERI
jgi:predicted nuclease with TOPRIM domain